MFKRVFAGSLFILFVACTASKTNLSDASVSRTPPYRVSLNEFVYPNQPCPTGLCAIPTDIHTVNTDYVCTTCTYFSDEHEVLPVQTPLCPNGMVEIEGDYYPIVRQTCLYMVDNKGQKTDEIPSTEGRCGEFSKFVESSSGSVHKHYCIDKYEYPNQKDQVPQDWLSWYDAQNACTSEGKRLCTRSEWTFAAEGPNMHPYPYGDGFHRDRTICNFDQHLAAQPATIKHVHKEWVGKIYKEWITVDPPNGDDVMKVSSVNSDVGQALHNMLVPSGGKEQCVSDWGVYDMPGNVDEWVVNESGKPFVSGLMGGHVFGVRNASRPMTDAHGPTFSWYETGTRCCKTPSP